MRQSIIKINMLFEEIRQVHQQQQSAPYEIKIAYDPYLFQNDFNVLKNWFEIKKSICMFIYDLVQILLSLK